MMVKTFTTVELKLQTLCKNKKLDNKLRGGSYPLFFLFINTHMATVGPLHRQPEKLDYASPTQFVFVINQLPKVQFFTVAANIPGITLGETVFPTPFRQTPIQGDDITFDNFEISFIVDEYLENYLSLHTWITVSYTHLRAHET